MPVKRRTSKARTTEPDVIAAVRTGQEIEYSPERWDALVGAYFFGEHNLGAVEQGRARSLLDAWRELQKATESGRYQRS